MNSNYKIFLLFSVLIFGVYFVQSYSPPYFAKIDSISSNAPDCLSINASGRTVYIENNCQNSFSVEDFASYYNSVAPGGSYYDEKPDFYLDCWHGNKGVIIINGTNMCDPQTLKSVKSGTVVKTWNITILSNTNESIIVTGNTIYENTPSLNWILTIIPILFIALSIILFLLKYLFKKNIHIVLPILSLGIGLLLFFLWVIFPPVLF